MEWNLWNEHPWMGNEGMDICLIEDLNHEEWMTLVIWNGRME